MASSSDPNPSSTKDPNPTPSPTEVKIKTPSGTTTSTPSANATPLQGNATAPPSQVDRGARQSPGSGEPNSQLSAQIKDPRQTNFCIVCGQGSNRTDWKNTDHRTFVACDSHSDEEIQDARSKLQEQNAKAGANEVPTSPRTGLGTPQTGPVTGASAPTTTAPAPGPVAGTPPTTSAQVPTAGQQVRSTQAPSAAPSPQNATANPQSPIPGSVPPKGSDPTKSGA